MGSYSSDISDYLNANQLTIGSTVKVGNKDVKIEKKGSGLDLDMTDFLTLMVTELTNQGIDGNMDTSEMLNQMVQMQMVQALANMTDASVMSYAASLVGKGVTVAKVDSDGQMQELYGEVTGTGTMNGQQVVFVNDEYYYMNEIMAVGKLPQTQKTEPADKTDTQPPQV